MPLSWCSALAFTAALLASCPPPAAAQRDKPSPQPEDILPESELDDPIGLDAETRRLGQSAAERPPPRPPPPDPRALAAERARFGPEPPAPMVRVGEVLATVANVREAAHHVTVALAPSVALIDVKLSFESRAARPAELRYRLAVPDGSTLLAIEVCNDAGCRDGVADPTGELGAYDAAVLARPVGDQRATTPKPVAHARLARDARGQALVLRAAPVAEASPLTLRVRYRAPTRMHGGVVRVLLPARGMDPQIAPAELQLNAPGLLDPRIGRDPAAPHGVSVEPWSELALRAQLPSGAPARSEAWLEPCETGTCASARAWAGPREASPLDLVIALDVSPSTEGPARGRLVPAVAALLAAAPPGSRVRALAFAARAQDIASEPLEPSALALAPFERAVNEAELGSATRFEAVWTHAREWLATRKKAGLRRVIALVGDGGLTRGEADAFERARAAGVEVSAINTGDRGAAEALRSAIFRGSGVVLDVGAEADAAARGRDPAPLAERLAALFAPNVVPRLQLNGNGKSRELGPLRAGELVRIDEPARGAVSLVVSGRATTARRDGQQPGQRSLVAVDARDLRTAQSDWPSAIGRGTRPSRPIGEAAGGPPSREVAAPSRSSASSSASRSSCDRRGPAQRQGGISSDAAPVALAEERVCKPVPVAKVRARGELEVGTGMPADPLLDMLRRRIMPVARGCFRRDRGGRPEYQKRAIFAFTLAEREVVDAKIEGKIPDALRTCLLKAVDTLDVPRFSGTVIVRYPLVTEAQPLSEQIELRATTAASLDRLFPEHAASEDRVP
jgi:hypothetical protein